MKKTNKAEREYLLAIRLLKGESFRHNSGMETAGLREFIKMYYSNVQYPQDHAERFSALAANARNN